MVIDVEKYFLKNGLYTRIADKSLIKENIIKDFPNINDYNENLKLIYKRQSPVLSSDDFKIILSDRCFQALSSDDFKKSTILNTESKKIRIAFNAAIAELINIRKTHESRLIKIE